MRLYQSLFDNHIQNLIFMIELQKILLQKEIMPIVNFWVLISQMFFPEMRNIIVRFYDRNQIKLSDKT